MAQISLQHRQVADGKKCGGRKCVSRQTIASPEKEELHAILRSTARRQWLMAWGMESCLKEGFLIACFQGQLSRVKWRLSSQELPFTLTVSRSYTAQELRCIFQADRLDGGFIILYKQLLLAALPSRFPASLPILVAIMNSLQTRVVLPHSVPLACGANASAISAKFADSQDVTWDPAIAGAPGAAAP